MPDHHRSAPPGPKQTPPMVKAQPKAQAAEPVKTVSTAKPKSSDKTKAVKRK